MKLSLLLAHTEHGKSVFKEILNDYTSMFVKRREQNEANPFKGVQKTYTPRPGQPNFEGESGIIRVASTVQEKLDWLEQTVSEHIDNIFSLEATNSIGVAVAELVVDNISFGNLSANELLRLISTLQSPELVKMYSNLPVRDDAQVWNPTNNPEYNGRDIHETKRLEGVKRTTENDSYILPDPNIQYLKDSSKYSPQIANKASIVEQGDYTLQFFSGETTHLYRAEILRRRSKLLEAAKVALKEANEAQVKQSDMKAKKLFSYLHTGTL